MQVALSNMPRGEEALRKQEAQDLKERGGKKVVNFLLEIKKLKLLTYSIFN